MCFHASSKVSIKQHLLKPVALATLAILIHVLPPQSSNINGTKPCVGNLLGNSKITSNTQLQTCFTHQATSAPCCFQVSRPKNPPNMEIRNLPCLAPRLPPKVDGEKNRSAWRNLLRFTRRLAIWICPGLAHTTKPADLWVCNIVGQGTLQTDPSKYPNKNSVYLKCPQFRVTKR